MAARLVIGRAGTGKTALCVREILAEMAREALGGALLWIVPEQGTFGAERLLLTGGTKGIGNWELGMGRGTFRAQVISFRRLAMMIARDVGVFAGVGGAGGGGNGGRAGKPMDEVARVVLLEEMVRRERGKLTVFASVADRPGFVKKLDATLRELRQHGHSGASLREVAEKAGDAVMRRKLLDLAVLLEGWARVAERPEAWDFEYVMHQAALKAGDWPAIAGARVWVDELSAFSALELRMLAGLGLHARELTITLLADPDAPAIREMRAATGGREGADGGGLFARTERLYLRLVDTFRRQGVEMAPALALRQRQRFADEAVRRVEAVLFEEGAGGDSLKAAPPGGGVEIWECSDPETEVRMAAQGIRQMVLDERLRYRQIAVIVPELDEGGGAGGGGYQDAIRRVFAEHGIPHFIDARRSVAHHPLVELLRSAVGMATSHFDREEMLLLLKTQLAGVSEEEVALVENYVIEHGISHVAWDAPWTWVAPNKLEEDADEWIPQSARARLVRVNEIRQRVWGALRGFMGRLDESGATDGARFPAALRDLLATLNVERRLREWIVAARGGGQAELAQVHEQVWREIQQLLTLLETILTGRQYTLIACERLLATALQSLTLGLIPPTVDQVLVSSVTRSRVPEMEVVLVLGAVEGQFPKVVSEDPILSDAQREAFNAVAADPIDEGSDRQLLEMPFFDYVALTRARRRLIVSCPQADRQGKRLGCSRHVARLRELLASQVVERKFDAGSRTQIARMATVDDLLAGVTAWARGEATGAGTAAGRAGADDDAALMPAVYNWLVTAAPAEMAEARQGVWGCVEGRPAPRLAAALAARFFPAQAALRMSVSQLEKFAACPLQYFVHYTLGLRPRAEFQLDQLSLGELQHKILERVYRHIIAGDIKWPGDIDKSNGAAEELRHLLETEVDGAIEELHAEIAQRTPGYEKTRARLKRVLGVILEADRRRALLGEFRPEAVELFFGKGSEARRDAKGRLISLPVLSVPTIGGRVVEVRGKIDRMDAAASGAPPATVLDYKSAARKSLELFRVLDGIALQLPTYALVARELAGREPVAALYMPLGMRRETLDHEAEAKAAGSDEFLQQFKPRGLVDAADAWRLDPAARAPDKSDPTLGKSLWYNLTFNKGDGAPRKGCDLLRHEDFQALLAFTRWTIARLGDELAGGRIAPEPYRVGSEIPCAHCDFASLCPFDQVRGTFRELQKEKPDAVIEKMREQMNASLHPPIENRKSKIENP